MNISGFGHGKVILFGEHAVVYDQPAVVLGTDDGISVQLSAAEDSDRILLTNECDQLIADNHDGSPLGNAMMEISRAFSSDISGIRLKLVSTLPVGVGMGSSAALCVAMVRAFSRYTNSSLSAYEIEQLAAHGEKIFHHRPSGIDVAAATSGGVMKYRLSEKVCPITLPRAIPLHVYLVEEAPSTALMVQRVADYRESHPDKTEDILKEIGEISEKGVHALQEGDWNTVGSLMNQNHQLLRELGVSTKQLDKSQESLLVEGYLGVKLTGAGGGGCLIALAGENVNNNTLEKYSIPEKRPQLITTAVGC